MKIRVTRKDIREGIPESVGKCPVALAMSRVFKWPVNVRPDSFRMFDGRRIDTMVYIPLPRRVRTFIRRFDDRGRTQPFTFNLTIPKGTIL